MVKVGVSLLHQSINQLIKQSINHDFKQSIQTMHVQCSLMTVKAGGQALVHWQLLSRPNQPNTAQQFCQTILQVTKSE